jgi:hypothetical protein
MCSLVLSVRKGHGLDTQIDTKIIETMFKPIHEPNILGPVPLLHPASYRSYEISVTNIVDVDYP